MSKPLDGIKIIDFTHVQAGPACTQMLAWFGADVIKVERPGSGDVTRSQLRDIPGVDALYFTMLNSNKKSLTLDTKKPEGKEVLEKLIRESDVLVENFGPGALDRMGFTWERINELNPKMIVASVKGFSDGHHYDDLKVYENVAQCAGGAASTSARAIARADSNRRSCTRSTPRSAIASSAAGSPARKLDGGGTSSSSTRPRIMPSVSPSNSRSPVSSSHNSTDAP